MTPEMTRNRQMETAKEAYGVFAHRTGATIAWERLSDAQQQAFLEIVAFVEGDYFPECPECHLPLMCSNCDPPMPCLGCGGELSKPPDLCERCAVRQKAEAAHG